MVTTATYEPSEERNILHLEQIAEKDLFYRNDSTTTWEQMGDILTMTVHVYTKEGTVSGIRKFIRHNPNTKNPANSRKMSAPFWLNINQYIMYIVYLL